MALPRSRSDPVLATRRSSTDDLKKLPSSTGDVLRHHPLRQLFRELDSQEVPSWLVIYYKVWVIPEAEIMTRMAEKKMDDEKMFKEILQRAKNRERISYFYEPTISDPSTWKWDNVYRRGSSSLLHEAASEENLSRLRFLLAHTSDPDLVVKEWMGMFYTTPLHVAVFRCACAHGVREKREDAPRAARSLECMRLLLEAGASTTLIADFHGHGRPIDVTNYATQLCAAKYCSPADKDTILGLLKQYT